MKLKFYRYRDGECGWLGWIQHEDGEVLLWIHNSGAVIINDDTETGRVLAYKTDTDCDIDDYLKSLGIPPPTDNKEKGA